MAKRRRANKSGREKGGAGTVRLYGRHAVKAALDNPRREIDRLVGTREALARLGAAPAGMKVETAAPGDVARLVSPDAVHQGLVLFATPLETAHIEDVTDRGEDAVVIVLDQVTDPHNVGAIMRSAAAFGAIALITQDRHSPPESGALAKAASGALESLPWVRVVNLARALEEIARAGYWRIGLDGAAERALEDALPSGALCLVMGAEGRGLRPNIRKHCDDAARLPIGDKVESLNVSNAAAIALYEAARRRRRQA